MPSKEGAGQAREANEGLENEQPQTGVAESGPLKKRLICKWQDGAQIGVSHDEGVAAATEVEEGQDEEVSDSGGADPSIEARLEEWVAAKRARDCPTADRLREELRTRGVDAEAMRPGE